MPDLT